jgi:glycosyltransferase involved in cell wall biosynthesis
MPSLIRYWGSSFKTPREAVRIAGYFSAAVAAGWECWLVSCRPPENLAWADPVTESGVRIEYLPRASGNFDRACVQRTWRLCRRVRPDVFHCDNTHTSPLVGAWTAGVRVRLWSKHAMEPAFEAVREPSFRERLAPSLKLSIALCTQVLPISHAIEKELIGLGVPPRKLTMLPLPVAENDAMLLDRAAARERFGFRPEDVVISTIGRAVPVKGWDVLLRALAAARERIPAAKLLLAGSTAAQDEKPFYERLVRFIDEHGLAGSVRFTGHLTDIGPALRASDMFVLPSRSEGYSLALLEALTAGLPAVSTRVGIAPEVIVEGRNGRLVERENASDLARGLVAMADPAERQRCTASGPTRIPGIPSAAEHSAALLALYERLLGHDRR